MENPWNAFPSRSATYPLDSLGRCSQSVPMISTIGEAHDLGWRIRVYCREWKGRAMKKHRGCTASVDIDLPTLVWTRGRDWPISDIGLRMKCIRCGGRLVAVALEPPPSTDRKAARVESKSSSWEDHREASRKAAGK